MLDVIYAYFKIAEIPVESAQPTLRVVNIQAVFRPELGAQLESCPQTQCFQVIMRQIVTAVAYGQLVCCIQGFTAGGRRRRTGRRVITAAPVSDVRVEVLAGRDVAGDAEPMLPL